MGRDEDEARLTDDAECDAVRLADELAADFTRLLGDLVVAVILHGSLVLGDFVPGRSDIDVLVVVQRPLADGELEALRDAIVARRGRTGRHRRPRRHAGAASSPMKSRRWSSTSGIHGDEAPEILTRVAEPDLLAELSMVRADGRSLIGDEPSLVVGDVPAEWVIAYGDENLARWERLTDDAEHAELMVLTACRIWRFALEGVHCSKSAAGRWALARDPSLAAVEDALRLRAGEPDAVVEPSDIAALIERVREVIRERAERRRRDRAPERRRRDSNPRGRDFPHLTP